MSEPVPFIRGMPIPFIRVFPNGRNGLTEVIRPREIEALACRFIATGGRYLITIDPDGTVKLAAAVLRADGEPEEAASETCENGPQLLMAVDRLVRKSAQYEIDAFLQAGHDEELERSLATDAAQNLIDD